MKLHYDSEVDALHLVLDEAPIAESEEIRPGVVLDYNVRNEIVGIEILGLRQRFPGADPKQVVIQVK